MKEKNTSLPIRGQRHRTITDSHMLLFLVRMAVIPKTTIRVCLSFCYKLGLRQESL